MYVYWSWEGESGKAVIGFRKVPIALRRFIEASRREDASSPVARRAGCNPRSLNRRRKRQQWNLGTLTKRSPESYKTPKLRLPTWRNRWKKAPASSLSLCASTFRQMAGWPLAGNGRYTCLRVLKNFLKSGDPAAAEH